ncbi:MAG: ABC transporter ATP-binding protein, partial [Gammaproteobacteria bacterium]|nr:ABC transporter ATP-binding protein [Gammaproteobacteria bacterium]
ERTEIVLRELQLWDRRAETSRNLSGGMKRRLMIARALVHEPRLLILDEPTAGVDIEIRRSMWAFLRQINEQGTTIILTTHYLEEAENLCRHVGIIDAGQIVEHDRMSAVLRKLRQEIFVLSLADTVPSSLSLIGFDYQVVNEHEIEVEVHGDRNLNQLFEALSQAGVQVSSMRNKTNRLEELFMRLVDRRDKELTERIAEPEIRI